MNKYGLIETKTLYITGNEEDNIILISSRLKCNSIQISKDFDVRASESKMNRSTNISNITGLSYLRELVARDVIVEEGAKLIINNKEYKGAEDLPPKFKNAITFEEKGKYGSGGAIITFSMEGPDGKRVTYQA